MIGGSGQVTESGPVDISAVNPGIEDETKSVSARVAYSIDVKGSFYSVTVQLRCESHIVAEHDGKL